MPTYTTAKFPAAVGQVCQTAAKSNKALTRRRLGIKSDNRQIYDTRGTIKEETDMADLSVLDLQNLRHLIGGYSTSHCKMQDYASQAQDPEVKKLFQDAANSAMKNKQDLMKFL